MKILIVHMRYRPDPTGTAPLITELAEDLVGYGMDVTVITSLPHYGLNAIHPDFQEFRGRYHTSDENGVEIIRTPVFVPRHPGMVQRSLNYLSYNFNSIIAGFKVRKVDLILAVNPPITTIFAAWILGIFHRAPLVTSIQDVWPDCIIQVGKIKNPRIILGTKILERLQYWISKKIVVLSRGMKENLLSKGVNEKKIIEIPNWADPSEVIPVDKENQFYQKYDLSGKFVVLFAGNHGYIAALEYVLEAAKILSTDSEILFILAGEGSVKEDLVARANVLGLSNVLFLSTQPKKRWLEMLAAADIGLVTLKKELAELNVPSKVYTLMSAARPIMASVPEGSEIISLITQAECGRVLPPESPSSLAEEILIYKKKPRELEIMGQNGRNYLLEYLSRNKRTQQYYQLLTNLVSQGNVK